jgi:hypothetical protein
MPKDWEAIMRELSSDDDSDAGDSLNVLSVTRNAHRVAQLAHGFGPMFDPAQMGNDAPMGMNDASVIREGLAAAMHATSRHSRATLASPLFSSTASQERPVEPRASREEGSMEKAACCEAASRETTTTPIEEERDQTESKETAAP